MQIKPEQEKSAAVVNGEAAAATLNHGPDDFPALNPLQVQLRIQLLGVVY